MSVDLVGSVVLVGHFNGFRLKYKLNDGQGPLAVVPYKLYREYVIRAKDFALVVPLKPTNCQTEELGARSLATGLATGPG